MQQQINFYQDGFRFARKVFGANTLLIGSGVITLAMLATYVFALYTLSNDSGDLLVVRNQEKAAIERLENFQPNISGAGGEKNLSERLEDATNLLREKELVHSLVRGSTLGDSRGFSRYLRSLARQDTDGLRRKVEQHGSSVGQLGERSDGLIALDFPAQAHEVSTERTADCARTPPSDRPILDMSRQTENQGQGRGQPMVEAQDRVARTTGK